MALSESILQLAEEIIKKLIQSGNSHPYFLDELIRQQLKKHKQEYINKPQLLQAYHKLVKDKKIKPNLEIERLLQRRWVRSLSGVAVVTVLTKPFKCPGQCLYCPNEDKMPKSYIKNEPAAHRAFLVNFNPYKQVKTRLATLKENGHPIDKVELIVLGGTWSAYSKKYQYWFLKECFRACNNSRPKTQLNSSLKELKVDLKKEQKKNEKTKCRLVGLTLETRPDCIDLEEIKRIRDLGCTRIELGVQSIYNDILKKNKRGHLIETTIKATKLLKNAGFKINYHIMLNLPGSSLKKDYQMFKTLFSSPDFKPDLLKIYPCAVLKTAELYQDWQKGKYHPYSLKELTDLIVQIKKIIPYYVRIQRVIRDIPSQYIEAGVKVSNLRQLIDQKEDKACNCIRCREIKGNYQPEKKIKIFRQDYKASDGQEVFLSFEDLKRKNLYALLRLRLPEKAEKVLPVLKEAALIREVHTYGRLMPLAQKNKVYAQHQGLGKKLMQEAEAIVQKEFPELKQIAVISGVGVRGYYQKLGYRLKEEYMVKKIR